MSEKTNEELAAIIDDVAKLLTEAGAVALREAAARLRQQSEDSARLWSCLDLAQEWAKQATACMDTEDPLARSVIDRYAEMREAIDKARKA